jgi:hypothetical protein
MKRHHLVHEIIKTHSNIDHHYELNINTSDNMKRLPKGIGAGNVGTQVWSDKWKRYNKMKEFGRMNEQKNKV